MSGFLIGIVIGSLGGWLYAHKVVSDECDRPGRFYVGERVYHCVEVEKP